MSKELLVCVLSGDAKITMFMQSCDVFEKSKIIAKESFYKCTVPESCDNAALVQSIRHSREKTGHIVAAVFIEGDSESAYINDSIKSISNGSKWYPFETFKRCYGLIKPEMQNNLETA